MKIYILQLKAELKQLASKLKELKSKTRQHYSFMGKKYPNQFTYEFYKSATYKSDEYQNDCKKFPLIESRSLDSFYIEYRAKHIAYCMLRGRSLEQIEPKLRDPNSMIHTRVRKDAAAMVKSVMEKHANERREISAG